METIEETTLLIVVMSQNTTQRQQFTQTQKKGNAWDLNLCSNFKCTYNAFK